mmetsp:Transcript_32566/g.103739  ORF Transcript_32566/g.103739 Transcript_32566/m.103739 type:complete len:219 (+) Transcript_32566:523-1179(+)
MAGPAPGPWVGPCTTGGGCGQARVCVCGAYGHARVLSPQRSRPRQGRRLPRGAQGSGGARGDRAQLPARRDLPRLHARGGGQGVRGAVPRRALGVQTRAPPTDAGRPSTAARAGVFGGVIPLCAPLTVRAARGAQEVPQDRVVACGDSGNDLAMLSVFPKGVVVANAHPELTKALDEQSVVGPYFARGRCAAGVVEGALHFGFFGEEVVPAMSAPVES